MRQSPQVGKTLRNRYKIIETLGTGGFGDTYRAVDLDLPGQPQCVVKHLKPKNLNPAILPIAKRLFEREAQILFQLGSENSQIPKLFAHFEENGEFYLVQEFVDGYDLSKEIAPGKPLNEGVVFKLLKDILEVLAVVHQHNVIHRDIKPQNLMRRKDGKIVLIDFGAVKQIGAMFINAHGQTSITVGVGTPGYMPGEQANGRPKLCSDVYAVGIIGIQALTGLTPQQLKQNSTTGEVIWRNFAQVSDSFADILDTMVRDHFSQRYQSAALALQALISTMVSLPPPPTPPSTLLPLPLMSIIYQRLNSWLFVRVILLLSLGGYGYWQLSFNMPNVSLKPSKPDVSPKPSKLPQSPTQPISIESTSLVKTLIGHNDQVGSVAISPNGQTLVSGSEDHSIKIWHLSTGTLVRTLSHSNGVTAVAISSDGQTLVTGSRDSTIKIWHLSTGTLVRTLSHSRPVASVAISRDGQTLVSGSSDTIKIWKMSTGIVVRTLTGHSSWVESLAISRDGQTLVSGSWDNTIKIWNLSNGSLKRTISGHCKHVFSVVISPNGQFLISSSLDNTIKIWNLANGSLKSTVPDRSNYAYSVAISPDSQLLVSGSADNTVKIWQLSNGHLLRTLTGHSKWVQSVAISSNGQTLVSSSADNTIKIWRLSR
jgi:WD40 repeat protein